MGQLGILLLGMLLLSQSAGAHSLFSKEAPRSVRQNALRPFFEPSFDSEATFDHYKILNFDKEGTFEQLSGGIVVTPPKGVCFSIRLNPAYPDQRFCKKGVLKFRFHDLDSLGRISAMVHVDGDFGTAVQWKTPYRVAMTLDWLQEPTAPRKSWLIKGCAAYHDEKGRRMELDILGENKPWTIYLPKQDASLPQPADPPNLKMLTKDKEGGTPSPEERQAKKVTDEKVRGGEEAGMVVDGGRKTAKPRRTWHMPLRDSFEMSADNFQSRGHVPEGGEGICWYRYKGTEDDPDVGRLECHDVDRFRFVYTPLPCVKDLKFDQ